MTETAGTALWRKAEKKKGGGGDMVQASCIDYFQSDSAQIDNHTALSEVFKQCTVPAFFFLIQLCVSSADL